MARRRVAPLPIKKARAGQDRATGPRCLSPDSLSFPRLDCGVRTQIAHDLAPFALTCTLPPVCRSVAKDRLASVRMVVPDGRGACVSCRVMRVNGVDLCVDTIGDRRDPAVLLISGAGGPMDW